MNDSIPISDETREFYRQMHQHTENMAELNNHIQRSVVDLSSPHELKAHMLGAHGYDEGDFWRRSHADDHPALGEIGRYEDDRPLSHPEIRSLHEWEHGVIPNDDPDYGGGMPGHFMGDSHFHMASLNRFAKVDPEFFDHNPPTHENIIAKWHESTPEEKTQGEHWYKDAHTVAHAIAGGDTAKGAGILANYSPQSSWPVNLFNAARVLHHKRGMGGKGDGIMASEQQKAAANRMLDGEHHSKVLKGHKVRAFASLIEHGGRDKDDASKPSSDVCVDRHAMSVAVGRRLTEDEFGSIGLQAKGRYNRVADAYRTAADHLTKSEGREIAPHHVQATTWLAQQRQNQAQDDANSHSDQLARGRTNHWNNAVERWKGHVTEHHPELAGQAPTAFTAVHEAKAPLNNRSDDSSGRHKNRITDSCSKCGSDIYLIDSLWLHDDDSGAGLPHQALPTNHDVDGSGHTYGLEKAAGRERLEKGSPEYKHHYNRGWAAGTRGSGLERADDRGEPNAWYDGYMDAGVGRPKWSLMHHDSAEAAEDALASGWTPTSSVSKTSAAEPNDRGLYRHEVKAQDIGEGDYLHPFGKVRVHNSTTRGTQHMVFWKLKGSKAPGMSSYTVDTPMSVWRKTPPEEDMQKQAYGETKAPIQVDTLRDAECPVCGDTDSFDGDQCQVCGYVAPPAMFRDPDLDKARLLDLRANPATGDPNNTDPNIGTPGPSGAPVDPNDPNAMNDPNAGIVNPDVQALGDVPMDPNQLDANGNPVDLSAADGRVPQGGDIFQQGPDAPQAQQFMEQGGGMDEDEPIDPADVEAQDDEQDAEEGVPTAADGQQFAPGAEPDPGVPGTPGDGIPDLMCPSCGFQADAATPLATSTDINAPSNAGDGMQAGDVCPNCQQAALMSVGEMEQMQAEQQTMMQPQV